MWKCCYLYPRNTILARVCLVRWVVSRAWHWGQYLEYPTTRVRNPKYLFCSMETGMVLGGCHTGDIYPFARPNSPSRVKNGGQAGARKGHNLRAWLTILPIILLCRGGVTCTSVIRYLYSCALLPRIIRRHQDKESIVTSSELQRKQMSKKRWRLLHRPHEADRAAGVGDERGGHIGYVRGMLVLAMLHTLPRWSIRPHASPFRALHLGPKGLLVRTRPQTWPQ